MYIALVQNNPTLGALAANVDDMLQTVQTLQQLAYPPDLVIWPAYALTGQPLAGLATSASFAAECLDQARRFLQKTTLPCLFGSVAPQQLDDQLECVSEAIYVQPGGGGLLGFSALDDLESLDEDYGCIRVRIGNQTVAIFLEDIPDDGEGLSDCDLIIALVAKEYQGCAHLLTSANWLTSCQHVAKSANAWLVVANLVGGQDELIYDGGSLIVNPAGELTASAPLFRTAILTCNLSSQNGEAPARSTALISAEASVEPSAAPHSPATTTTNGKQILLPRAVDWQALELATHDYLRKNGFTDVVLGLSGGIDSALVAVLASDALGAEHVHALLLPSAVTAPTSQSDALELAGNLGIEATISGIDELLMAFRARLSEPANWDPQALAVQNLQARLRMICLMYAANQHNWLLLNTSNKSEAAVGYSTLYGDSAGGFAPFGNIYKTDLYELAVWRNSQQAVIPASILHKPPTAELFSGQLDTDTLPPYELLDRILRLHIEDNFGLDQILDFLANLPDADPVDADLVSAVLRLVQRAEFKRRQEPLAPNLGSVSLTDQRAWPITNGFRDRQHFLNTGGNWENLLEIIRDGQRPSGLGFLDN